MSEEEQLQLRKDTLWDIHKQKKLIACLEKKLSDSMESMKEVHEVWKSDNLGASQGYLVRMQGDSLHPIRLSRLARPSEILNTVRELSEAKHKLEEMKDIFSRMGG